MPQANKEPAPAAADSSSRAALVTRGGLFEMAFRHSPAMQSVLRASDGVIVEVNDTFLQKLHRTREQVIGKTPVELQSWVEPEKIFAYRNELEKKGFVRGYEARLRGSDGNVITALLSTHAVEIEGVRYYVSAGVDITARKEAEARLVESERQLRESEARFSTAFRACPILMNIAHLPDGGYVEVNDAFVRWVGLDRSKIIDHSWPEFAKWENPAEQEAFFAELERTRSMRNVECRLRLHDDSRRVVLVSADIIEINREPHILGFANDITEQKKAEQALRDSEAELQNALAKERELNQLKSDFVSLVSHEFRTPLEIIMSSADNLERYHDRLPAEKREQLLHTIRKSVRRMSGMMEEVLVLGRVESGKTEFKPAKFNLSAFCRRVGDEIQTATGNRCPVEVKTNKIPDAAFGDENLVRHILTNLLSNAVKYSEVGKRVTLKVAKEGSKAVFSIVDRGCGIPAAEQGRLFQAFHRGSNVRQIPGTGLGLVIVKRCVELHGGDIHCKSAEGSGTTFTVTLPLYGKTAKLDLRAS
jgi:PAS domain S-box-containing protein